MKTSLALAFTLLTTTAIADETRQLGAHEHGVGQLDIALGGGTVAMELRAPGADIVGFEYAAKTAEDRAAIETAVATLARPLDLFDLPAAAECTVTQASAELESGGDHDHADDHDGDEHEHAEHHGATHSEFHAEYLLSCADTAAITEIAFTYFDVFENARELEVQLVTGARAQAFEVPRSSPLLDLRGMF